MRLAGLGTAVDLPLAESSEFGTVLDIFLCEMNGKSEYCEERVDTRQWDETQLVQHSPFYREVKIQCTHSQCQTLDVRWHVCYGVHIAMEEALLLDSKISGLLYRVIILLIYRIEIAHVLHGWLKERNLSQWHPSKNGLNNFIFVMLSMVYTHSVIFFLRKQRIRWWGYQILCKSGFLGFLNPVFFDTYVNIGRNIPVRIHVYDTQQRFTGGN